MDNTALLAATLSPQEIEELRGISDAKARLTNLQTRTAALSLEAEAAAQLARTAFRDRFAARFENFDWKVAVIGGSVEHSFKGPGVVYHLRLPSSGTARAVERLHSDEYKHLRPFSDVELTVVAWLVGVTLGANPRVEVGRSTIAERLEQVRALPDVLLARVADECLTLQAWLNVQLELNSGN